MGQPTCVLCAHYRPQAETHPPDRAQTCPSGRRRIEAELLALRSGYRRLLEPEYEEQELPAARRLRVGEAGRRDAVNTLLPGAAVSARSNQSQVTGTRDRRLPVPSHADLTAPAQRGSVTDTYLDQTGRHSVASVLLEWISYWCERFLPSIRPPKPSVEQMIDWIVGVRLEQVADQDPHIVDFAQELQELLLAVRGELGDLDPRKQPMWGIPCPRCALVSQLLLDPDDPDEYRECANCNLLMTRGEYRDYLRALVEKERPAKK